MDLDYKEFENKSQLYAYLHEQLRLIGAETSDFGAVLANAAALLKLQLKSVNWAGFYLLKKVRLVLGPFQGKPAVAEIAVGTGVCGTAVQERKTQLVADVHACCNHIACDLATNSEIVTPIFVHNEVVGVIDIDSPEPARFDHEDVVGLEEFAVILASFMESELT